MSIFFDNLVDPEYSAPSPPPREPSSDEVERRRIGRAIAQIAAIADKYDLELEGIELGLRQYKLLGYSSVTRPLGKLLFIEPDGPDRSKEDE